MKIYNVLLISLSIPLAAAQAQKADLCVEHSTWKAEDKTVYFTVVNNCPGKVQAYWVALHPGYRDLKYGSGELMGSETRQTFLKQAGGIAVYACKSPQNPRDAFDRAPTTPVSSYRCK